MARTIKAALASIYWQVFGTFSKGVKGALSLNFGQSGGANCATSCRHHPIHFAPGGVSQGEDGECSGLRNVPTGQGSRENWKGMKRCPRV